jgi:hypothetical protein
MLAKAAASEIGPGLPFLNVGRGPGFKIVLLMARRYLQNFLQFFGPIKIWTFRANGTPVRVARFYFGATYQNE